MKELLLCHLFNPTTHTHTHSFFFSFFKGSAVTDVPDQLNPEQVQYCLYM